MNTQETISQILDKHLLALSPDGVTYEERRKQAERERLEAFVLDTASFLSSLGVCCNINGNIGKNVAEKRLRTLRK